MSTKKNIKARQKKIIKCLSYIYKKRKIVLIVIKNVLVQKNESIQFKRIFVILTSNQVPSKRLNNFVHPISTLDFQNE